jgi:hypothetical protein
MSERLTEERALAAEAPGFRVEELPNGELVIASVTGASESVRIIGYDQEQGTGRRGGAQRRGQAANVTVAAYRVKATRIQRPVTLSRFLPLGI